MEYIVKISLKDEFLNARTQNHTGDRHITFGTQHDNDYPWWTDIERAKKFESRECAENFFLRMRNSFNDIWKSNCTFEVLALDENQLEEILIEVLKHGSKLEFRDY